MYHIHLSFVLVAFYSFSIHAEQIFIKNDIVSALLLFSFSNQTKQIFVEPAPHLKDINTSQDIMISKALFGKKKKKASKAANTVTARPSEFSPPVYYAMSAYLFHNGEKDQAMRWFYSGQVRARYDANRCADISAHSAVASLNRRFATKINRYAVKDLEKLEKIFKEAIAWSLSTPHTYDHRWINLHGMKAFIRSKSTDLSLPKKKWDKIRTKTHKDYLKSFEKAMKQVKEGF